MEDFLMKLHKISEQYDNLLLEKKIIDKRISSIGEDISKYEETKQKLIKEIELKKNKLLKNKNKHLIKCQKMEELNNKLNEVLIRKQSIDDVEEKKILKKQIDTVNNTFVLLKNVQKLNDIIAKNSDHYKFLTDKIHNNSYSNKKTLDMLNSFLNKSRANIQDGNKEKDYANDKGDENSSSIKDNCGDKDGNKGGTIDHFKIIPTNEMSKSLTSLLANSHTTLNLEQQQFLFVLLMNILKRSHDLKKNIIYDENKSNQVIHDFLYHNYISLQ